MFKNKKDRKKLATTLEKKKHLSFDAYLHLAQYWQSRDEIEKAKMELADRLKEEVQVYEMV